MRGKRRRSDPVGFGCLASPEAGLALSVTEPFPRHWSGHKARFLRKAVASRPLRPVTHPGFPSLPNIFNLLSILTPPPLRLRRFQCPKMGLVSGINPLHVSPEAQARTSNHRIPQKKTKKS